MTKRFQAALLAAVAAFAPQAAAAATVITGYGIGPALIGRVTVASKSIATPNIYIGDFRLTGPGFNQTTNCVDLEHYLGTGTYSIENMSVRVSDLTRLKQLTAYVTNGREQVRQASDATAAATKAAALQLGIWELLYETGTGFDVTAGDFASSGNALGAAQTLANGWLAKTVARDWRPLAGQKLQYLSNSGLQSQTFVAPLEPGEQGFAGAVPEPAAWAMMIGGMAVVGGTARRWRRAGASPVAA